MSELQPTRGSNDLADVVELLLDKGVVINADIAVSVGDTELLDVHVRAAVASFETAAQYGLEFPAGTDRERIEEVAGRVGERRAPSRPIDDTGRGAGDRAPHSSPDPDGSTAVPDGSPAGPDGPAADAGESAATATSPDSDAEQFGEPGADGPPADHARSTAPTAEGGEETDDAG